MKARNLLTILLIGSLSLLGCLDKQSVEDKTKQTPISKNEAKYLELNKDVPGIYTEMLDTPFVVKNNDQYDSIMKGIANSQRGGGIGSFPIFDKGSVFDLKENMVLKGYGYYAITEGAGHTGRGH